MGSEVTVFTPCSDPPKTYCGARVRAAKKGRGALHAHKIRFPQRKHTHPGGTSVHLSCRPQLVRLHPATRLPVNAQRCLLWWLCSRLAAPGHCQWSAESRRLHVLRLCVQLAASTTATGLQRACNCTPLTGLLCSSQSAQSLQKPVLDSCTAHLHDCMVG